MARTEVKLFILAVVSCLVGYASLCGAETETLRQGELLRDYEQLLSANGRFRLGFFDLDVPSFNISSPSPRYLGIWFDYIPFYPVWVAKVPPVPDSSGTLIVDDDGKLKIKQGKGATMTVSSFPSGMVPKSNVTATLLDSGNLVLREAGPGRVLWQSFDHPSDTLLPGMKLGFNLKTGQHWSLTSWASEKNPSAGAFSLGLQQGVNGTGELVIRRRGEVYWTSGPWRNGSFHNASGLTHVSHDYQFRFVANDNEVYFTFSANQNTSLSRWRLHPLGFIEQFYLLRRGSQTTWAFQNVGACLDDVIVDNKTALCINEKPNKCRNNNDVFVRAKGFMLSDESQISVGNTTAVLSVSDCHAHCWKNCSCIAFGPTNNDDGTGCVFWGAGATFTPYDDDFARDIYLLAHRNRTRELPKP